MNPAGGQLNFDSSFCPVLPIDDMGKCARGHGLLPPNSIIGGIVGEHERFAGRLDPSCLTLLPSVRIGFERRAREFRISIFEFRTTIFDWRILIQVRAQDCR